MRIPARPEILTERLSQVRDLGLADVYAARRPYEQLDVWHAFGEDGSGLGTDWVDPGLAPPQWMLDPLGIVHVRGIVEKTTTGTRPEMAVLPLELAPVGQINHPLWMVDPATGTSTTLGEIGKLEVTIEVNFLSLQRFGDEHDRRAFLSHSWVRAEA